MSKPVRKHVVQDEAREDAERFLRDFYRAMAAQGMIVRPPKPGAVWTPPEYPMPVTADELSAMVVRLRRAGP